MAMLKKLLFIIISAFLLSGCTDSFRNYFKLSANNKYIDNKGFKGGKRKPLYNKKYVEIAKRNVAEGNYDEDEYNDDEDEAYDSDPARLNRLAYMEMAKRDAAKKKKRKSWYASNENLDYDNTDYPSLVEADSRVKNNKDKNVNDNKQLQQELAEIKAMLNEAKNDLARYKCPLENESKNEIKEEKVKFSPRKKTDGKKRSKSVKQAEDDSTPSSKSSNHSAEYEDDEDGVHMSPNPV